jgi:hypothetical protein
MLDHTRFEGNGHPAAMRIADMTRPTPTGPQPQGPFSPAQPVPAGGSLTPFVPPVPAPSAPAPVGSEGGQLVPNPAQEAALAALLASVPGDEHNPWKTLDGKLCQYRRIQADRADALRGSLGMLNAGLMDIAGLLEGTITSSLASFPQSSRRVNMALSLIDAHLRVLRQIERMSVLERTLPNAQPFL